MKEQVSVMRKKLNLWQIHPTDSYDSKDIGHQNDSDGDGVFSEAEDESSACRETLDTRMESMYSESFYANDSNSSLNPSVVDPAYNRGEVNDAIKVGNDALSNAERLYEVYMRASSSSSKQGKSLEPHRKQDGRCTTTRTGLP